MSVVEELSGDGSRIVTSWKRTTVADGDWLQHNTISPLNERDVFLAKKIDELSGNADDRLDEEIEARKNADTFLSETIDTFSGNYETFKSDTEGNIDYLSGSINGLKEDLDTEKEDRNREDGLLQAQIDTIKAATDVIMVYGTYDNFETNSASLTLTDNDVIKVLADEHLTPPGQQVYYQYSENTETWTNIGELSPYYSKAEIDDIVDDISGTIANTYLSANGVAVQSGHNIVITKPDGDDTPHILIETSSHVTFDGVSSTNLSSTNVSATTLNAATAYGQSAKFTDISATNLTALTATGNSAKFTDFSGTNIHGGTNTATIDALISSAQNGQDSYDKVSTAYWSAYKDSTHSGSGKLSANFSISAGENLDMEISDNIIKLNGKPAGVIHDDNLSGLGVQGDLLGLNSAVKIYVPFIADQNRSSAFVEIGNTPVPYNLGSYNEGFAVYRNHTYEVREGTKTADLGTTINFTGMVVTHSADSIGGFSIYSKYGDVFDLNYNGGDYWLKHLWLDKNGLNFTDNSNPNYSATLNFVNLKLYDNQNNIPGTNTKYETQNVNASSIYKWNNTSDIVTQSATLQAGQGIGFYSAGPNILGISAEGTKVSAGGNINNPTEYTTNVNLSAGGGVQFVTADNNVLGIKTSTMEYSPYNSTYSDITSFKISAVGLQGTKYESVVKVNDTVYGILLPDPSPNEHLKIPVARHDGVRGYYYLDNVTAAVGNYVSAANSQKITIATATTLPSTLEENVYYLI